MSSGSPVYFSRGIPANTYEKAPFKMWMPMFSRHIHFKHTEGYFHAHKYLLLVVGSRGYPELDFFMEIVNARPLASKAAGRELPIKPAQRRKWDEYLAPTVMLQGNLAKFRQNAHCAHWLTLTNTRPLVEHRRDPIWGDNLDGTGKNQLGKILEVVRACL